MSLTGGGWLPPSGSESFNFSNISLVSSLAWCTCTGRLTGLYPSRSSHGEGCSRVLMFTLMLE